MEFSEEKLSQIEEFAKLPQYTPLMIATAVSIDGDTFLDALEEPTHPIYLAYQKGILISKGELDKKIIQLSNQGSGPAQSLHYKQRLDNNYFKLLEKYGR